MTTLTFAPIAFQSIEEYKTWRTEWKQQYNQLSADIRIAKQALRQAQRGHSLAVGNVAISASYRELTKADSTLARMRSVAREAISQRLMSKVKAAQLYIIEHRVEATTE